MATNYYDSFIKKLKEIFMMDHAELDFGIYRIMNQKRQDIMHFLEHELLPQVKEILNGAGADDTASIKARMQEIETQAASFGASAESNPEYQQLKAKLAQTADTAALQNEVFSHLVTFFSRYYDNGDFVSKRRYKDNTYAIPYNGEEVKLHWANADQYYIKSSEYFRDYTFVLPNSRRKVHFVLKDVTTEQNNNKAANNMERRFALYDPQEGESFFEEANEELNIFFTYELMPKATKQDALVADALGKITVSIPEQYDELLSVKCPTDKKANRTLLEKHLTDYTAKNSFDYFIHKDLGVFLRRELDFYIKNEVMLLDDLDTKHIQSQLTMIKAIKQVGDKIIRMLAQLEDFQKKLWLKKKFVVQSDYCITLDRVPEELYEEIIANDKQREEWVRLFAIDEIKEDLATVGYSVPLTIEFLKQNPFLVLDTAFFSSQFKHKLISHLGDKGIDEQCNGLLINSENFQALELLQEKYRERIGATITDPPYNTGDDGFLYKDNYGDSSWLSLMNDRLKQIYSLMKNNSWVTINSSDIELFNLMKLIDSQKWSSTNHISVKMSHLSGMKMSHIDKKIPKIKEQILTISKGESTTLNPIYEPCEWDEAFSRYTSWINFNNSNNPDDWTKDTVRNIAKSRNVDVKNKAQYDEFRIRNAANIFRTAVNDAVSNTPKDNKFRKVETQQGLTKIILNGEEVLFASSYMRDIEGKIVPVQPKGDIWTDIGINNAHNEGGVQLPNGKKPVKLFERLINMFSNEGDIILDTFAGSATIVHAVINANIPHKYIAIQSDYSYFNEKTLRRSKNVIYSNEWKLDKPVSRKGISQCFKYIRLEQYEDTLNNLQLKNQQTSFADGSNFKESYMLGYMLDTETHDSLLNLKMFENPFAMTLKTTKDNELVETPVDMVETFNYLIGLNVETEDWYRSDNICVVTGRTHRDNLRTLVIWRNCKEIDNEELNKFFERMDFRTHDSEFDVIYVNGDNTLPNLKRDEDSWKVMLTEEEFAKRMFETE